MRGWSRFWWPESLAFSSPRLHLHRSSSKCGMILYLRTGWPTCLLIFPSRMMGSDLQHESCLGLPSKLDTLTLTVTDRFLQLLDRYEEEAKIVQNLKKKMKDIVIPQWKLQLVQSYDWPKNWNKIEICWYLDYLDSLFFIILYNGWRGRVIVESHMRPYR